MGDFNKVLYQSEEIGKREAEYYRMVTFEEMLNACKFMDIKSKECAYTWANYRDREELVRKRLDRMVCNMEWRVLFFKEEVFALLATGSYHSPILLSIFSSKLKRKKEFQLEAYWLDNLECKDIMEGAWNDQANIHRILSKARKVVGALKMWSRLKFSNAHKQIEYWMRRLMELINGLVVGGERDDIQKIKEKIEKSWKQEEIYSRMRSNINRSIWGDKNTKYFHATMIQRR